MGLSANQRLIAKIKELRAAQHHSNNSVEIRTVAVHIDNRQPFEPCDCAIPILIKCLPMPTAYNVVKTAKLAIEDTVDFA